MINKLWGFMLIAGIVFAVFSGNLGDTGTQIIDSAEEAVTLGITMLGIMSLWTGMMNIAKKAGLTDSMTRILHPVIGILFPGIPEGHIAREYIASNMIANILGLGWAATPYGLKAMFEMKKLNGNSSWASTDMCTFLILNISSLQLIPVNIIAYRSRYGSASPAAVTGPGLIATTISTLAGICFALVARKLHSKRILHSKHPGGVSNP